MNVSVEQYLNELEFEEIQSRISYWILTIGDILLIYLTNRENVPYSLIYSLLKDYHLSVKVKDEDQRNVIHYSVDKNRIDLTLLFISKGADVNKKCNCGYTALQNAFSHNNYNMVRILYYAGVNLKEDVNNLNLIMFDYVSKSVEKEKDARKILKFTVNRISVDYLWKVNGVPYFEEIKLKRMFNHYIQCVKRSKLDRHRLYHSKIWTLVYSYLRN